MPTAKHRGLAIPSAATLPDGNVLVALVDEAHVHHAQARSWFSNLPGGFVTCPNTQGTLLRLMMRVSGLGAGQATAVLVALTPHSRRRFWPDSLPYEQVRGTASWVTARSRMPSSRHWPDITAASLRASTVAWSRCITTWRSRCQISFRQDRNGGGMFWWPRSVKSDHRAESA